MYDKQVNIVKQKIEKLSKKAGFKKVPMLKISKNEHLLANASFLRKKITIGTKLLAQLQRGEIDEDYVGLILAHEIGHLMDFERKFSSVFFRYYVIMLVSIVFGLILPKLVCLSFLPEPCIIPLMASTIWAIVLIWIVRSCTCTIQIEADKNGARLITEEKYANLIVKTMKFRGTKGFGLKETLKMLLHVILWPSLSERLRNLNFEIKAHQLEIRKIKG